MARSKPVAVLISDLHFTVPTLELASQSLVHALEKGQELQVPVIIAGDLLDAKAIIRAEVANRLVSIFSHCEGRVVVMMGNHDMINEKGSEHSLNFLRTLTEVVSNPVLDKDTGLWFIPYQNDPERLQALLKDIEEGVTLIMHQGVLGADMGHYVKDSTSLPREAFQDFRVISGHYHKAQDIKCGRPRKGAVGLFSYIGSPYTISFAEAGDGPKGFRVLWSDGTLESVPTDLREHRIFNRTTQEIFNMIERDDVKSDFGFPELHPNDVLWFKVTGPVSELDKVKKVDIAKHVIGHSNFKLDKIPTEYILTAEAPKERKDWELLDSIIDRLPESPVKKEELKKLWREVLNEN